MSYLVRSRHTFSTWIFRKARCHFICHRAARGLSMRGSGTDLIEARNGLLSFAIR